MRLSPESNWGKVKIEDNFLKEENKHMKLKEIYFGSIDAKEEFSNNSKKSSFEKSFLVPDNVNLKDFETREKYFLYGMKGTGKTALLRYMSLQFSRNPYVKTSFVLFKSNFTEDDRKLFNSEAVNIINRDEFNKNSESDDFENIWIWFFLKYIVDYCEKNSFSLFTKDDNWKKLVSCVSCIGVNATKRISDFLPRIENGEVSIDAKIAKITFGFEPANQKMRFLDIIRKAEELLEALKPDTTQKLYLFIDELELEYSNQKNYSRDAKIIRDLIVVTKKLNSRFSELGIPIYCITSVRSEVLTAVESVGKEINKCIEDYGTMISWHQFSGNLKEHPLIQIIIKRLLAAENLPENDKTTSDIFNRYFPDAKIMNGIPVEKYILHNTWYRPRDIVRFLNLAKDAYPCETCFSQKVFESIRKKYSTSSWTDCMEEMKAHYDSESLKAIVSIFSGWRSSFSKADFDDRLNDLSQSDRRLSDIIDKKQVSLLLERLYHVGVIGNKYYERKWDGRSVTRIRYVFRGDENILLNQDIILHKALIPYFSASSNVARNGLFKNRNNHTTYYYTLG